MKMRLKWLKSSENHKAKVPKLSVSVGQKSMLRHCYSQNVKDGIQSRVCMINKVSVAHFSQFISVEVKKDLGKSRAQFRVNLKKLRLTYLGNRVNVFIWGIAPCPLQLLSGLSLLIVIAFVSLATVIATGKCLV